MNQDYALLCDKYAVNMIYGHWRQGSHRQLVVIDVYFRKNPFQNGFVVFAGLERIVDYIQKLRFDEQQIEYLRSQEEKYDEAFLQELRQFSFSGDLFSVPEGEIVFPNEPIVRIKAPVMEALLMEAFILNVVGYQSLIATKAARIKRVTGNDGLLEFGARRAQECDASIWGARSTYIAGFDGTSNMQAGMMFGIPTKGTHSHAWVQNHESELIAFERFAETLPDHSVLLVDTYDTLRSGVPNAITVAHQLEAKGYRLKGIRIDSGDLTYLSIEARKMLDEAGLHYVKIVASNDLDENIIADVKQQKAAIDIWGIGTKLITAEDSPALGAVYKVVARLVDEEWLPSIKLSGNPEKITTPGYKKVYRISNLSSGQALGDYVCLADEHLAGTEQITLFDPVHTYLSKKISQFKARELLKPIIIEGQFVYSLPTLEEIRIYHKRQLQMFSTEYLRRLNPERYLVSYSSKLWKMKNDLLLSSKK